MLPEDIDDVFRQKLDGHATPPGNDLWARLQLPATEKEPLDQLFREGLHAYPTPPRRELWERLEDEHLRPQPRRKRRVAAWWQYAAAAVLLVLLAGGAGLWRGGFLSQPNPNVAATQPGHSTAGDASSPQPVGSAQAKHPAPGERPAQLAVAQPRPASASRAVASAEKNQEYFSGQATAPLASTSSPSIATTTRPRRPATTPQVAGSHRTQGQQPDAAAGQLASSGGRKTPAGQQVHTTPVAPAATVALATSGNQAEAPTLALMPSPAKADASLEIIEVDVRRSPEAGRPAATVVAAAAPSQTAGEQPRRRLRLGGLLRQADHLVHGEPVSLAEATGLPESLTLQARLGGRTLSKTIQL